MAKRVHEIMNGELMSVGADERTADVLEYVLSLGISGVAILDGGGRPVGIVTFRDLASTKADRVHACMSSPVDTVPAEQTIEAAAQHLAETNRHRLVVVDEDGRAVGMLSTLDVIRGLLGLPAIHPAGFPHFDSVTSLSWSDDAVLAEKNLDVATDGPGVLALVHGGAGIPERVVWVEGCNNVRLRLLELLNLPQSDQPLLERALRLGHLRFRSASAPDEVVRRHAVQAMQARAFAALRPASARGAA